MTMTFSISAEDKRRYREDGYWISPKLLDDEGINRLRRAHDRIWEGDFDGDGYPLDNAYAKGGDRKKLRQFNNGWWINDNVRAVVTDPAIGKLAADLLETDEVRLWHDQVIWKPGTEGETSAVGNVGWHQDFAYWQCLSTDNVVTVWIALQDTDLSNGGMMTILGSHKWGLIKDSDTFYETNMDALRAKYESEGRSWVEEPCILKAGQASFHHGLTFHGSGPNLSSEPRLSVVAHLIPGGTAYRSGVQYHGNAKFLGPRPQDGQLFANDYFPVVYRRNREATNDE
ncbi:phytanoyl-CoA dioxygenase family protein [Cohnella nanjingensis]|uniref:Phytanoyl-CoA dioxygenase family protein n=2 Tax=Cohnella nanjingensis TaxID=1387779 RepID=A0A7X0RTV8_9BACL|nr:phytanoyl-CoA dioxygenase family protein [Cohnella nanjingensis]